MTAATQIKSPTQLLVEGNDQRNFFEAFLGHLSPEAAVHIHNYGGGDELRGFLKTLPDAPGFEAVQSIGIVRDAETSAISTFRSIQSSLENANLPIPIRVGQRASGNPAVTVLVLQGEGDEGMLETLLCKTFANTPLDRCIDAFFECARTMSNSSVMRPDKARARVYLTTKPESHVSVGVAAKKGYWDLDHPAFVHVGHFLKIL